MSVVTIGVGASGCGGGDEGGLIGRATELADTWGRGWSESDPDAVASVFTEHDHLMLCFYLCP